MRVAIKRLSVVACIGMFLVLMMGAAVTSTGSSEGCGKSWPLCHGQFIPEFAFTTAVEYSHRAVTGFVGLILGALSVGSWWFWRRHREIAVLAPLMLALLFLQSGLGAWAVLAPQSPAVLALHFGISLLCFGSVFLTMMFLHQVDRPSGRRDSEAPVGFRRAVWCVVGYVYLVVYLGAYVRHTDASLACLDWPLCNGALIPTIDAAVGAVILHRGAALLVGVLLVWLTVWATRFPRTRPDLIWGTRLALALVAAQIVSGALLVISRLSLPSSLAHAGIMALLFATLSYLCLQVLPAGVARNRTEEPTPRVPAPARHAAAER